MPKHKHSFLFLLGTVVFLFSPACRKATADADPTENADSSMVVKPVFHPLFIDSQTIASFLHVFPQFEHHAAELQAFYKNREHSSAWFNDYGLVEQGGFFMNLLTHFSDEGLEDTIIYNKQLLAHYNTISDPEYSYAGADSLTTVFELMLTAQFFTYGQKVFYGLNEQKTKELDWYIERKTVPSVDLLDSVLSGGKNVLMKFEPPFPQYALLKKELKHYREMDTVAEWDSLHLPAGKTSLKLGDDYAVVRAIKYRLYVLGDLAANDTTTLIDSVTDAAIKHFQLRHGLIDDGAAGNRFFIEINTTIADRIEQIEINMERCRWIPGVPDSDYILVNIPAYIMYIYAGDSLAWTQNVVVGKTSSSTVIFNDELEYVVFSPYWVPPPSIVCNEILPALKKNPGYLAKENMEVVDRSTKAIIDPSTIDWNKYSCNVPFIIRQKPGGSNSLGWVKFLFPNEHNIYFHDTPSRNLFTKQDRGFSHGCIRVQEPKRFATYLLRYDSTYTTEVIDSLYYLGKETYVKLAKPVPVYIVYFTAWVNEHGELEFRRDIYGHDSKLEKTLFADEEKVE